MDQHVLPESVTVILKKAQQVREREKKLNCLHYTLPNSGKPMDIHSWLKGMETFLNDSSDLLKAGVNDFAISNDNR